MREILFRGLRTDGQGWVEGDLINLDDRIMIAGKEMQAYDTGSTYEASLSIECVEVHTETVGQFTGLLDKNGKRIFEGDLLTHTVVVYSKRKGEVHTNHVDFFEHYWRIGNGRFRKPLTKNWIYNQKPEITGNIHETPAK